MKKIIIMLVVILCVISPLSLYASGGHDDHGHEDEHEEGHGHHEMHTEIHGKMASKVGIETAISGPQVIKETATSYGKLVLAPEQTSHVRARFPGVIKSVQVTIGDIVKVGDLMAVVESNESLKKYNVQAPIAGIVVQRHANAGEMTQNQVLFSISNFETLWAELKIFPSQLNNLGAGQSVYLLAGTHRMQSTVSQLIPSPNEQPYMIARVQVQGKAKGLFPGIMVEGRIMKNKMAVGVAVENIAIQEMEGQKGIFIMEGEKYSFKPVEVGRSDYKYTEIVSGLTARSEYVTKNSFLIKSDIEKSEAEHQH